MKSNFKVFSSNFLEDMDYTKPTKKWSWKPANDEAFEIYASGAPTSTNQSTYAGESDDRNDTDRPNEGLMAV